MVIDFEYGSMGRTYEGPRLRTAGNVQVTHTSLIDLDEEEPLAEYGSDGAWYLTPHGHRLAGGEDERPFTDFVIAP